MVPLDIFLFHYLSVAKKFTYLLQELSEDTSLLELQQLPPHRDSSKESSE